LFQVNCSQFCYSFASDGYGTYEISIKDELSFLFEIKENGVLLIDGLIFHDQAVEDVFETMAINVKYRLFHSTFEKCIGINKENLTAIAGLIQGQMLYIDPDTCQVLYEAVSFVDGIDNEHVFISDVVSEDIVQKKSSTVGYSYFVEEFPGYFCRDS